ncbi:hypothetical protein QJS10_CPB19g01779 [Acorus calamus]|uniref:RRM domain-containing protein n=1 Tax=Acorus calamus TaxID=4465 RepID=A0AAV9CFF4_ACOCL|nr:hypothetical protein QJS10_CPB19g01779 [Acorus calamus]
MENSLFVCIIPRDVDTEGLREFMSRFGEVEDFLVLKDEDARKPSRGMQGQYGLYNAYITLVTRYAAHGALMKYDYARSAYGRVSGPSRGMGKKLFVGKLPQEASSEDLRQYFGRFGQITDVCVPKNLKKAGHRGFGFVTFAEDGAAYLE